jgi:molybdopterin converting factor small subunit
MLQEERGLPSEILNTVAATVFDLYEELRQSHSFTYRPNNLRVAVNDQFVDWHTQLKNNDKVVFIPPVAGG